MNQIKVLTIGADPEVFVIDSNNKVTSAIGFVGGSKEHPKPVSHGAVQEDNILAEFNIDPATCKIDFVNNIDIVMLELQKILDKSNLKTSIITSHNFNKKKLLSWGEKAMEFGCSSEWNAWTERVKPKPKSATTLRTAGGHIHVGYDDPFEPANYELTKMLDYVLGLQSVLIDKDSKRRALYGKAGSMRHKPYGMEYRTLSNFWLKSQELKEWVYDKTIWAADNISLLTEYQKEIPPKKLQNTINKSNKKHAKSILRALDLQTL